MIDPTVGIEGHSLRMVEQEDSIMNSQDRENQEEMDIIKVDQKAKVNKKNL